MFQNLLSSIFGSRNQRLIKQYSKVVAKIAALEPAMQALDDAALLAKTTEFKDRVAKGETLDALLPEAFAMCRETSKRVMGMRHFDAQMIGGMVLHDGKIAEMRTGEGKTLTATLAVYLNALAGKGVHVVTVNDYLASRDAQWMGKLYNALGMTVGVNLSQMDRPAKQAAYAADITYGTNNEFGFDYLRDNLVMSTADRVQRPLHFGIVDEVDSILIDEARTPLIISGQADDHTEMYVRVNAIPTQLSKMATEPQKDQPEPEGDYWVDEKGRQVHLSEAGHIKVEAILENMGLLKAGASLYDVGNITLMHHVMVALKAHTLYHRDQQYVVQEGEVVIVDEHTGRLMVGRRWSEGIHQSVEAKEGVAIQHESQTLASVTFQNFFRLYEKLAGMTGTADTEAYEFQQIYFLETVVIPTHRPMVRKDQNDLVYRSVDEKYAAMAADIAECYARGQPVLVGTTSVEQSEIVSALLSKEKLPHEVLNAKQHLREADIIAQAGKPKAITVATNMAGRGTDIVLGGNVEAQVKSIDADETVAAADKASRTAALKDGWQALHDEVLAAGGLKIVGGERHESRRIDNQLRGRAGRQGDPGSSRFYMSMDDPLLRIFGGDRLKSIMNRLKLPEGEPIEAGMVTRSIESAQRKVEGHNFDMRKQLLEYDDVANDQRKVIYEQRNDILEIQSPGDIVSRLRDGVMHDAVRMEIPEESLEEQWDIAALDAKLSSEWQLNVSVADLLKTQPSLSDDEIVEQVQLAAKAAYQAKVDLVGTEGFGNFERTLMLQVVDQQWREHLTALDHLRQGIHLRGYAQKNPKQEYKREAFEMFGNMLDQIKNEIVRIVMTIKIRDAEELEQAESTMEAAAATDNVSYQHADPANLNQDGDAGIANAPADEASKERPFQRFGDKIGRNDACPCGSGKKYKACHGKLA